MEALLGDLEWARGVFETYFGLKSRLDRKVLILIPDSPFDYEQLSPAKRAAGYYLAAPWRDMIVLRELFEARRTLLHEYTHLVLRHQGGRWPLWFHEGTAEYYATMSRNKDGNVEAGIAEPKRFAVLKRGAWLPIDYLTSTGLINELTSGDATASYYAKARSRVIGKLEVEIARRTVAVSGPARGEARSDYYRLARAAANRCDLQAAVGDLAYAAQMMREASSHYQAALKCGTEVADLAEGYESAIRAGEKIDVSELPPKVERGGHGHWHYRLGTAHFFEGNHASALKEFELATGLPQTEEFCMRRLRAMSLVQLGRFQEAEEAAEGLRQAATNADQRQAAHLVQEEVRRGREQAAKAEEPYHKLILRRLTKLGGFVVRVDCMGQRARVWIQSGGATRKLLIADPGEVITGESNNPGLEFACGPQKRRVFLGYQEQADPATDTVGRIRYMEFPK